MIKERDFISAKDFSRDDYEQIFAAADKIEPTIVKREPNKVLEGFIVAALFFEPSTRTRLSFETAAKRLGGEVIGFARPEVSSVAKGEDLLDTVRTVEQYADVIIMRHPEENSASYAASRTDIPIINAGDGSNEHPTQAMLDLYTMKKGKKKLDGLSVALVGDLKFGRTVHSLTYALTRYEIRLLYLVSPAQLRLPEENKDYLSENGVNYREIQEIKDVMQDIDVLYVTRVQKERFESPSDYEKVKDAYKIVPNDIEEAKDDMIILHPFPRTGELSPKIDQTPHAKYFDQMRNGVPIRMSLLSLILGKFHD